MYHINPTKKVCFSPLFLILGIVFVGMINTGCDEPKEKEIASIDDQEWKPGGDATNLLLLGSQSFIPPAPNLSIDNESLFFSGNSFFNQAWVEAPASTLSRDGLGPTFNSRSCSGCHTKDGRGAPPEEGEPFSQLLLRISLEGHTEIGAPLPVPGYGTQLQSNALPNVPIEGVPQVEWIEVPGQYPDGTSYSLRKPRYWIDQPAYGDLPDDLLISPRVAPIMIGLGLLEAIPHSRLLDLADPEDEDGDGISGKPNWVWDIRESDYSIGRFGWKAEQPNIEQQTAGAFLGDMGLTSELYPSQNCPTPQMECLAEFDDGMAEIDARILERVTLYTRTLAIPGRREYDHPEVLRGKLMFHQAQCGQCHVPSHRTEALPTLPEFADQLIWPYTDLLLHDLGEELSDHRPSYDAQGSEWKTPPLWGLGLIRVVNKHEYLLHDGRARGVEEAILWHGGEAEDSRRLFKEMNQSDRTALIRFVRSL